MESQNLTRSQAGQVFWPSRVWLSRHGESAGNVARAAAEAGGLPRIEIAARDADVPLSELGQRQARALGRWFAAQPVEEQPSVILSSPYVRAMQTTALILEEAKLGPSAIVNLADERLREKEFGSLNRLTGAGILATFPAEAELRASIGKFYYRPPGGESWCDVLLRLRSVLDQIQLQYCGQRVLIMAHQVVVLCFRYLFEDMNEDQLLRIDRDKDVANCSLTAYELERDAQGREALRLRRYNDVTPLDEAGEPVTKQRDATVAPR